MEPNQDLKKKRMAQLTRQLMPRDLDQAQTAKWLLDNKNILEGRATASSMTPTQDELLSKEREIYDLRQTMKQEKNIPDKFRQAKMKELLDKTTELRAMKDNYKIVKGGVQKIAEQANTQTQKKKEERGKKTAFDQAAEERRLAKNKEDQRAQYEQQQEAAKQDKIRRGIEEPPPKENTTGI